MATSEDDYRGSELPYTSIILSKVHTVIQSYHGPNHGLYEAGHFTWMEEVEKAFVKIKRQLTNAPILVLLDFNIQFKLHVDASKVEIIVVLSQEGQLVALFNEKLSG